MPPQLLQAPNVAVVFVLIFEGANPDTGKNAHTADASAAVLDIADAALCSPPSVAPLEWQFRN